MTAANLPQPNSILGIISFAMGSLAVLLVLVHFWAGPFAPQERASVTIGEIAADIRQSALRKLKGESQPKPVAEPWDIDRVLKLVAAVLAGLAVVAGAASLVRRESWRPAVAGAALGVSAITFQFFAWAILIAVGAIIISAIIHNIGDILGG